MSNNEGMAMPSLLERIIIWFVIVGGIVLAILYVLYMLVGAIKAWLEANPSWAALLALLFIFLFLAIVLGIIRWIEER